MRLISVGIILILCSVSLLFVASMIMHMWFFKTSPEGERFPSLDFVFYLFSCCDLSSVFTALAMFCLSRGFRRVENSLRICSVLTFVGFIGCLLIIINLTLFLVAIAVELAGNYRFITILGSAAYAVLLVQYTTLILGVVLVLIGLVGVLYGLWRLRRYYNEGVIEAGVFLAVVATFEMFYSFCSLLISMSLLECAIGVTMASIIYMIAWVLVLIGLRTKHVHQR